MKESPFNEDGLRWLWSASSSENAKACWRLYHYASEQRWQKKDAVDLEFGGFYAAAIESYHKLRAHGASFEMAEATVVGDILRATRDWKPEHHAKNRETLIRSIIWYLEEFKNDPCKTVILANGEPAVELEFRFQIADEVWFGGRIDRLVEYAGQIYVQDQKTTGSTISPHYFKRYSPNNQISMYALAAKIVYDTQVSGVMVDAAQIAVGFTRFERGLIHRTEAQLQEWLDNTTFRLLEQRVAKASGWPINDASCQRYGGCAFLEVCSKDPRVREDFLHGGFKQGDVP